MATTKVINDLIDLNQTGNTTALKGCKGDNANQPQTPTISVQYLVVGGGGGANGSGSGGGGAGGLSTGTIAVPNNTALNIVVGQGGLGVLNNASDGLPANQGQDSGFYTIQGQGGGAGVHRGNGLPGGSGAGAGVAFTTLYSGGNGVSGQGNNGGLSSATWSAGGGGGSGAVGTNGVSSQAGAGGVGSDAVALGIITQTNGVTANIGEVDGATLNFAGGGGGGGSDSAAGGNTIGGSGGLGGGGNGTGQCTNCPGGYATLNTGGGGGGSAAATADSAGGSGGSGVVILKYANADVSNVTIAGSLAGGITTGTTGICNYPTTALALYQLNDNAVDTCNSNQYPGTWVGTDNYGSGNFGKAATFSNGSGATSNYITLSSFMPTGSSSRSISMWIKTTSTAYQEIFQYGSGGNNNYFIFRLPAGGTQLGIAFYANDHDFTATNITDGNWHHCAATYDGNLAKVYYDGVLIGTGTPGAVSTGASSQTISGYQYTGSIDQVRCYDVVLTADQAAMLYAENVGATKFDDGTNTTLVFKSGSGTINLTGSSVLGPKVGDLRTNEDQTSAYSASAMEHFMSTGWRVFNNFTTLTTCNYPVTAYALYQFEDNVIDTCGTYNGTANAVTYKPGKFGQAADLTATNGSIEIPGLTQSQFSATNISVSVWVNMTSLVASGKGIYLFSVGGGSWEIRVSSSGISFGKYNGTSYAASYSTTLNLSQWYHIAATASTTAGMKLYLNGSEVGSNGFTGTIDLTFSDIGWGYYADYDDRRGFSGLIDQGRIFPSALTPAQVTLLYNET